MHDVFVEEYHVHRVIRQFGLRQEVPVPWRQRVAPNAHGKGVPVTTSCADRMLSWV